MKSHVRDQSLDKSSKERSILSVLEPRIHRACVSAGVRCWTGSIASFNHEQRGGGEDDSHVLHYSELRQLNEINIVYRVIILFFIYRVPMFVPAQGSDSDRTYTKFAHTENHSGPT